EPPPPPPPDPPQVLQPSSEMYNGVSQLHTDSEPINSARTMTRPAFPPDVTTPFGSMDTPSSFGRTRQWTHEPLSVQPGRVSAAFAMWLPQAGIWFGVTVYGTFVGHATS